ncbi:MAG TPA: hypothetical protein EYG44_03800 [Verrucomicrobia bacterium]|nr:hypothetical protein [Verrucomicrobiota bacterium]
MAVVAMGLAATLPLAKAAEGGPESFVTAPIKALEEKNPRLIWDILPASYQKDLNGLVQTFAKEMDAQLWDAGFELVGGIGEVLRTKKELIAGMLSEMDETGEIPLSEITSGIEMAGTLLDKLAKSDLGSLDKLRTVDLGNVADTFGRDLMKLIEDSAKAAGEADPFGLETLRGINVEVVSEDGDSATVKVSGMPEALDFGALTELPGGLPPGLPGLPDLGELPFADFTDFENGELELVKVEGKWIPKEIADGWEGAMSDAKEGMSGVGEMADEDKQMALGAINAINGGLASVKKAKTPEQFQMALMQAAMGVMMGAGGGDFGGPGGGFGEFPEPDVSPAQKAEARQLAEGEISLTNGDIIEGTVADVDQNGIVVRRDIGGFARRANWMQLTQQSLKKIRRLGQVDPKRYRGAAAYAEPFIEPDESKMEKSLPPGPVKGLVNPPLPSSVEVASKVAAFGSGGGLGLLVAIALGSMMAGLGVAAFRESNVLLVAGVSLFLPIIGPILFLVKPKVEYEDEYDEDEEYEYEEVETPGGATMSDTGGGAVAGMMPEAKKMSFAQTGSKKSGLKPQSWTRGDTKFDRSFFQNNFPNYFKTVIGATEREFVLALKTGKREYVGQRIKRISGTDIHMELLNGKEQKISFSEMGTVDLRPK